MEDVEVSPQSEVEQPESKPRRKKKNKKTESSSGKDDTEAKAGSDGARASRKKKKHNSQEIKDRRAARLEKRASAKENANYVTVRSRPRRSDKPCAPPAVCLLCEWGTCSAQFDNMVNFLTHVQDHLFTVFNSLCADGEDGQLQQIGEIDCEWRECGHGVARDFQELVRHVYLHAYHAKIKDIGARLVVNRGMDPCLYDTASRNMIPELPERLLCSWEDCGRVYDNPEFFYQHVSSHADIYPDGNVLKEAATCHWEGCDTTFKSKHKLRDHLRSHTQEKLVACPTCGNLFSTNTRFADHLNRQKNTDLQAFQCSHCKKKFATERLLRDHMRHHVNHYKCPSCEMTCTTPSSLRQHVRSRHNVHRPYACTMCSASFKRPSDQRRHMEYHNASRYKCHMVDCKYECISYASLSHHFRKSHQGEDVFKYACHVCSDVLYTRGSGLTRHLKQVHNFTWPPGHRRFKYKQGEDGYKRLNTIRYESIELTEQILTNKLTHENTPGNKSSHSHDQESPQNEVTPPAAKKQRTGMGHDFSYNLEMLGEVAEKSQKLHLGRKSVKLKQNKRGRRKIGMRNVDAISAKQLDCDMEGDGGATDSQDATVNCDKNVKPRVKVKRTSPKASNSAKVQNGHLDMPTLDSLVTGSLGETEPDVQCIEVVYKRKTRNSRRMATKSEPVEDAEGAVLRTSLNGTHKIGASQENEIDLSEGYFNEMHDEDADSDEEAEHLTVIDADGVVISTADVNLRKDGVRTLTSNFSGQIEELSGCAEISHIQSHESQLSEQHTPSETCDEDPEPVATTSSMPVPAPAAITVEIVQANSCSESTPDREVVTNISYGLVEDLEEVPGNAINVSCDSSGMLYGSPFERSNDFAIELLNNMKMASASSIIIDPATGSIEYANSPSHVNT